MDISQADRQRLEAAVRAAERQTGGELVLVIARSSDGYLYIPLLWASLVALALPGFLHPAGLGAYPVYLIQLAAFLGLSFLFQWTPLKMKLIPRAVKARRAGRMAREQFVERSLHRTRDGSGVLVFVSLAEHVVEIIADQGIDSKVPEGAWQDIVARLLEEVKAGRVVEGFAGAVERAGALLAEHCPRQDGDQNELPDRLVILE